MNIKPVILIVLDGYGIAPKSRGNAIYQAKPQYINSLYNTYPSTLLNASGTDVGLPVGEAGNTEVGHINLGAGRVVEQDLLKINTSISDGSFYKNKAFLQAINHTKKYKSTLHIMGIVGKYHVHASIDHLFALLRIASHNNCKNVCIHIITDGRDSPPKSAGVYLHKIDNYIRSNTIGRIASISGRYYAMDRDHRWERTEKAYSMLVRGTGSKARNWQEVLNNSYKEGLSDEFIMPTNIVNEDNSIDVIQDNDSVIFYNFRIDRPRQLTKAFTLDNFEKDANIVSYNPYRESKNLSQVKEKILCTPFKRGKKLNNLFFVTMTEYEKNVPIVVAYPTKTISHTLGNVISDKGYSQARIAESEKERFVTTYFNGFDENTYKNEDIIIVPSKKVLTYDLNPEMSAPQITDAVIKAINDKKYTFILINYANPDMVGHTGNFDACVQAIKTIDMCIKRIMESPETKLCTVIITGDHGNAEEMINIKTNEVSTEHSKNPVPCIFVDSRFKNKKIYLKTGKLADIAPTILSLLDIKKPHVMSGNNLLHGFRELISTKP